MVINNLEKDIKIKLLEADTTQDKLAESIGTTGQYVNRIIKKKEGLVNKTLIKIMEELGYDIEFKYVPRQK